jgi:hypothetical protein
MVNVDWVTVFIWLYPLDRVNFAGCCARAALDADLSIDVVRLLLLTGNCPGRARLNAQAAAFALHFVDFRA